MTQVKSQDISMKSKKQHIRLWYECFQICKSDPSLSNNLRIHQTSMKNGVMYRLSLMCGGNLTNHYLKI